jgi:hypothetical protein
MLHFLIGLAIALFLFAAFPRAMVAMVLVGIIGAGGLYFYIEQQDRPEARYDAAVKNFCSRNTHSDAGKQTCVEENRHQGPLTPYDRAWLDCYTNRSYEYDQCMEESGAVEVHKPTHGSKYRAKKQSDGAHTQ